MNKQFATGNLAKAAVVTSMPNDRDMLSMTIACNDGKDKEGNQYVEFIPAVVWGKKGHFDNIKPYLGVGQLVSVSGKLVYPKPNEKDGVVYGNVLIELKSLRDLRLLGSSKGSQPADQHEGAPTPTPEQDSQNQAAIDQAAQAGPSSDNFDDDIPF